MTALISLKYYYETFGLPSSLIIDEIDATLHPCLQNELLAIIRSYSIQYKIQFFCTTHSLSLLNEATKHKDNIIYLLDQSDTVSLLPEPTFEKIEMFLQEKTRSEMFKNKNIPIFTEDKEAREFIDVIFSYFKDRSKDFMQIASYFHFVEGNYASTTLTNLFSDKKLQSNTLNAICILDGDQQVNDKVNLSNNIILLPSNNSLPPDGLAMEYARSLDSNNVRDFWENQSVVDAGFTRVIFQKSILPLIESIDSELEKLKKEDKSTHGIKRELIKKLFVSHEQFFSFVFKYWVYDKANQSELHKFFKNLHSMFRKVATFHSIDAKLWSNNQFDQESGQNLSLDL